MLYASVLSFNKYLCNTFIYSVKYIYTYTFFVTQLVSLV